MRTLSFAFLVAMLVSVGCGDDDGDTPTDAGFDAGPGDDGGFDAGPADTGTADGGVGLTWTTCGEATGFTLECATIAAPLDYAEPEGETVDVALVRSPARVPEERVGMWLFNPGGPGISGVDVFVEVLLPQLEVAAPTLLDRFDVVAYDARGVSSRFELDGTHFDCIDNDQIGVMRALDFTPDDTAEMDAVSPDMLANLGSANTARDMDFIRATVGDEQLNFTGVSYGSIISGIYVSLFPENVRSFALDSSVAPPGEMTVPQFIEEQSVALDAGLERWFEWCGATADCFFLGGMGTDAVRAGWDALMLSLDTAPLTVDGRMVTEQDAHWGTKLGLWEELGGALATAAGGDGAVMLMLADNWFPLGYGGGEYQNVYEVWHATQYADYACPAAFDRAALDTLVTTLQTSAPRLGVHHAVARLSGCVHWPVRDSFAPAFDAPTAPPLLVVGTTNDPLTPYDWTTQTIAALDNGSYLLVHEGEGHAAFQNNFCSVGAILNYVLNPMEPGMATCAPDP
jgi:pimeloyl-ACP methyl ester carboxylesterase